MAVNRKSIADWSTVGGVDITVGDTPRGTDRNSSSTYIIGIAISKIGVTGSIISIAGLVIYRVGRALIVIRCCIIKGLAKTILALAVNSHAR